MEQSMWIVFAEQNEYPGYIPLEADFIVTEDTEEHITTETLDDLITETS